MSKILSNVTASAIVINDVGITLPAGTPYTIPPQDYLLWAASSDVISYIGNSSIIVSDGFNALTPSDGIDLLKGIFQTDLVEQFVVDNFAISSPNVEYTYTFPIAMRSFDIQTRNGSKFHIASAAGLSATTYCTCYPGAIYSMKSRRPGSELSVYFQSPSTDTLEIIYWI